MRHLPDDSKESQSPPTPAKVFTLRKGAKQKNLQTFGIIFINLRKVPYRFNHIQPRTETYGGQT